MFSVFPALQTNTHSLSPSFSAWELGPLNFLGPHPAFALALQLSTSFTWEWALVWRKSTQWHFPQCHIYRPPHRAGGTISQSDTVRPKPPQTIINCCPGGRWGKQQSVSVVKWLFFMSFTAVLYTIGPQHVNFLPLDPHEGIAREQGWPRSGEAKKRWRVNEEKNLNMEFEKIIELRIISS